MIKQTNSAPSLYKEGSFTVTVKNFGKIQEATLQFKDLTILAGPNNSGKSYVSKALYSIFSAMNIGMSDMNAYYINLLDKFHKDLRNISGNWSIIAGKEGKDKMNMDMPQSLIDDFLEKRIEKARKSITSYLQDNSDPKQGHKHAVEVVKKVIEAEENNFIDFIKRNALKIIQEKDPTQETFFKNFLDLIMPRIQSPFAELKADLSKSYKETITTIYKGKIKSNLINNFQVDRLSKLIGKDKKSKASIGIQFKQDTNISIDIDPNGKISKLSMDFDNPPKVPRVTYIESPTFWKLKEALVDIKFHTNGDANQYLSKVPNYFYELVRLIHLDKIPEEDNMPIVNLAEKISNIIGGKIIRDDNTKELKFIEYDEEGNPLPALSLLLTATGVVQLGIIGYLMENQIIEKGSILFIDEPEAHLHPGWQENFTEILYKLAEHGVKVIIATHSTVVMQKLELLMKDMNSQENIGLNFFDPSGKFDSVGREFKKNRNDIARSLNNAAFMMFYHKNKKK